MRKVSNPVVLLFLLMVTLFSNCVVAAPSTPTGLSLGSAVGSSTVTTTNGVVTLKWNSVTSSNYYHIQIRNLSTNQYSYFDPKATSQQVSVQKNVYYKWLVQACSSVSGCSAPSAEYTFLTK